jgi:hypothetical protein
MFAPGPFTLEVYCNFDWAGDPIDRQSTSGYRVYFGHCLISWQSKKQPVVSCSSTDIEYRSMAFATAELSWLRMLLKELQVPLLSPPKIWCDNLGAIALASNPIYHGHTKHVEINYHFIREKILHKDIVARYISTTDQCADIFTKGLSSSRFLSLGDKLMVRSSPISLRGLVSDMDMDVSLLDVKL